MRLKITPCRASGKVVAPPSKSMAHRLLISAAMSEGESRIADMPECHDVLATMDCLSALGIIIERNGDTVTLHGRDFRDISPKEPLLCRESGSTLRFLIPPSMLCGKQVVFLGDEGLMRRPMSVYEKLLPGYSADGESISVCGPIKSGEYTLPGDVSSQFISGLLFALPLCDGDSLIKITPPLESRSYIEMTIAALRKFGIDVAWVDELTLSIKGNQKYTPCDCSVEGDYSGAANLAALSALGGEVEISGLDPESLQGDRAYSRYFDMLSSGAATIDISDSPDLAPLLFALAAAKHGGEFTGTRRLKLKESDRAAAMAEELAKLGAQVEVFDNSVTVHPSSLHSPSEPLCAHGDHRIVMAETVLLTLLGGEITGCEAVAKSYPTFFEDLATLGVKIEEIKE